jgi:hypothetical protein
VGTYVSDTALKGPYVNLSRLSAMVLTTLALVACAQAPAGPPARPDHVLIMVFDQMRPDYIDRFDLKNFKRLRESSRHYPEAYIGHLGAQTIVSHFVIPTGLAPKDLPWQDDSFIDVEGVMGKPGAAYDADELTLEEMWRFVERIPRDRFLPARIQDALGPVFAVGEKDYAAQVFGGPHAASIVTLERADGTCRPFGISVPWYISSNQRFTLECKEPFGTALSTIYTLDGSHYVPGHDPARAGGDVWTADVALEIMRRERWSGLFLTFGGIDRVAHMLGEQDGDGLVSVPSEYRLADMLRIADEQLGRILAELEARGLSERTMIVVTSDHGGQRHDFYLGNGRSQTCCPYDNVPGEIEPPYWVRHLNALGSLKTAYVDSSITLWLADSSAANERALTRGLQDISGVTEVYAKRRTGDAYRYEQVYSDLESQSPQFRSWALRHSAELVDTMAGHSGPDLVALLGDGFGFGRIGGHGGAQEKVQRIPMIIRVPGEVPSTRTVPLRLMDLAPEILRVLGLNR